MTLSFYYYAISPETDCTYDTVEVRLDDMVVDQIGLCQGQQHQRLAEAHGGVGQVRTTPRRPVLRFRGGQ